MTREEVIRLLETIRAAYPNAKGIVDPKKTVDVWTMAFAEDPADVIYKAARHHFNTNRFFPNVADIRDCINKGQMLYGPQEIHYPAIPEAPNKLIPKDTSFCDLCGLCDIRDQRFCEC